MPQAVAARYASALADTVLDPKAKISPQQGVAELQSVESMVRENAELRNVLLSPAVSAARKRAVVARFAEALPLAPLIRNFLYVLIDRRRAGILSEVIAAFQAELDRRLGVARAQVQSAAPLSEPQRRDLERELSRLTGKQVQVDYSVDPALLGGVTARIGSTIYDGSVRTQLEGLRDSLVRG